MLKKSGLDVELKDNKIVLPTNKGKELYPDTTRVVHEGRHVRPFDLIDKLVKLNENSTNYTKEKLRTEIVRIINEERELLHKGLKQLNKNARDKLW